MPALWHEPEPFWRGKRKLTTMESLPEFLDELVFRSQCWCFVTMTSRVGFKVGSNEAVLLYVALKGSVTISSAPNYTTTLEAGDMVAIMDRRPHSVRPDASSIMEELPFLNSAQYVDSPPTFAFGSGEPDRLVLCGRLLVRWPGDIGPGDLPHVIKVQSSDSPIKLDAITKNAEGRGGAATLTQAAAMLLVSAMQQQPEFQALFSGGHLRDPISRAIMLMEERPHHSWTVDSLARKVGMGRSVFATRFFSEIGKPPFEVLTSLRMEMARDLILQTEMKISEVAEKVGYHSESAFHRRFTLHFNISPGKIRRDKPSDSH